MCRQRCDGVGSARDCRAAGAAFAGVRLYLRNVSNVPPSSTYFIDPRIIRAQVGAHVPGADAGDDRVEAAEVAMHQIVFRKQRHFAAHLPQRFRHFVARTHHIADVVRQRA